MIIGELFAQLKGGLCPNSSGTAPEIRLTNSCTHTFTHISVGSRCLGFGFAMFPWPMAIFLAGNNGRLIAKFIKYLSSCD